MKSKLLNVLWLACALAISHETMAQGFIGNGTGSGIKAVNSSGTLSGVNVGIGLAAPSSGATLEVADPSSGLLGLRFDNLPRVTDSTILYYEPSTGVVTYGPAPSAGISSVDFNCGVGTVTVNGVASAYKAWLLSGSTTATDSSDYFGTYNDDDVRINTNNVSCTRNPLKEKMVIGRDEYNGNVEIGWDGVTALPGPSGFGKFTVQNGNVVSNPYSTFTSSLSLSPIDIGIYSYANQTASPDNNNIGIGTVSDNNNNTGTIQNSIGFLGLVGYSTVSNTGAMLDVGTPNSGSIINTGLETYISGASGNTDIGCQAIITADNANNTGWESVVDGNNSTNAGLSVLTGLSSTTSNQNNGIEVTTTGSTSSNQGIYVNTYGNSLSNTAVGANASGNNASGGNIGVGSVVYGSSKSNIGYFDTVGGNSGSNWGILSGVGGSPTLNTAVSGEADGDNEPNTGILGIAFGGGSSGTGSTNIAVSGWISKANAGGNANSTCVAVEGRIDGGADGTSVGSYNYGVEGDLSGISIPSSLNTVPYYAVYGLAPGTGGSGASGSLTSGLNANYSYAGYFEGDVLCSNTYYYSDPKLKENIQGYTGALDQLRKLPVKSYTFRNSEYPKMNLPLGSQVGILSTDLKVVFPNLVKGGMHPGNNKDDKRVTFDAVNYTALIPVLIGAVQELNAKTDSVTNNTALTNTVAAQQAQLAQQAQQLADQTKQISELRNMIEDLCTNGCAGFNLNSTNPSVQNAALYQSVPNPASGTVSIGYMIAMPYTTASINLVTTDDKAVAQYPIIGQGSGTVSFDTGTVAAGIYKYYLLIDGKVIATRSMSITKD